jgi:hypothetical protein
MHNARVFIDLWDQRTGSIYRWVLGFGGFTRTLARLNNCDGCQIFRDIQVLARAINARTETKASFLAQEQRVAARYPDIESG